MDCDIHIIVQQGWTTRPGELHWDDTLTRRHRINRDRDWLCWPHPTGTIEPSSEPEKSEWRWDVERHAYAVMDELDSRNYAWFGALCGRRWDCPIPMQGHEERGLPPEIAKYVIRGDEFEGHWIGDYGFSWITAREIADWPGWGTEHAEGLEWYREVGVPWLLASDWDWRERTGKTADWAAGGSGVRMIYGFDN
jgi:hypothetical protein